MVVGHIELCVCQQAAQPTWDKGCGRDSQPLLCSGDSGLRRNKMMVSVFQKVTGSSVKVERAHKSAWPRVGSQGRAAR